MSGATVIVQGTTTGTTTTAGKFTIQVTPASILEVKFLGYKTAEVKVGTQTNLTIKLETTSETIQDVVVTALGMTRERKSLGYSVGDIKGEAFEKVRELNVINSLAGREPGLIISQTAGGPSGSSHVEIRGSSMLTGNNQPLYVVDGMPIDNTNFGSANKDGGYDLGDGISSINPDDIESLSVLTGASAAALYGNRGANGVILITTKKGSADHSTHVSYSNNTTFSNPFVTHQFQNTYGRQSGDFKSWGEKLGKPSSYDPNDFFQTGYNTQNTVSVASSSERSQSFVSAGSVNSRGIIPNNEYDRYNFTFRNTSYFLKDKLRLDASASYIYQKDQNMTNQGVYSNPLVPAYLFPRGENFAIYKKFERYNPGTKLMEQFWSADMEGGDLRMQNPYWIAYRNLRNTDKKRYMLSFSASYDILPWLSVSGRVRLDNSNSLYTQKLYASSNTTITDGGKNGHYTEARAYDTQTYADVMLNINKTFGDDWSLTANVGASLNNIKTDELSYRGPIQENGLPNIFNVFDLDDTKKRAEKVGWHDQTQSVFASVEVGWKQMLYLTCLLYTSDAADE